MTKASIAVVLVAPLAVFLSISLSYAKDVSDTSASDRSSQIGDTEK